MPTADGGLPYGLPTLDMLDESGLPWTLPGRDGSGGPDAQPWRLVHGLGDCRLRVPNVRVRDVGASMYLVHAKSYACVSRDLDWYATLLSSERRATLTWWHLSSGRVIRRQVLDGVRVRDMTRLPCSSGVLVAAGHDAVAYLPGEAEPWGRVAHDDEVYTAALSPSGRYLACVTATGSVVVHDSDSNGARHQFDGTPPSELKPRLIFSPDSRRLLVQGNGVERGGMRELVCICLETGDVHQPAVEGAVVAGFLAGEPVVFRLQEPVEPERRPRLECLGLDGTPRDQPLTDEVAPTVMPGYDSSAFLFASHDDEAPPGTPALELAMLETLNEEGVRRTVRVHEATSRSRFFEGSLSLSRDSRYAFLRTIPPTVAGASGSVLHGWELSSGMQLDLFGTPLDTLHTIDANYDATRVAICHVDGTCELRDTATGALLWQRSTSCRLPFGQIRLTPDARFVAASDGKRVVVYDVLADEERWSFVETQESWMLSADGLEAVTWELFGYPPFAYDTESRVTADGRRYAMRLGFRGIDVDRDFRCLSPDGRYYALGTDYGFVIRPQRLGDLFEWGDGKKPKQRLEMRERTDRWGALLHGSEVNPLVFDPTSRVVLVMKRRANRSYFDEPTCALPSLWHTPGEAPQIDAYDLEACAWCDAAPYGWYPPPALGEDDAYAWLRYAGDGSRLIALTASRLLLTWQRHGTGNDEP